jgi:flagellar hook protein FlgE
MMDVVGDNIANINTPGFKGSRVVFSDTLSQALRAGGAATEQLGGTNASQIGLGVRVGGIDMVSTQGPLQATGRPTDVAIQGEGFFVVRSGSEQLFTRAGSFGFDNAGNLADPSGAIVQGWLADPTTGALQTNGPISDIQIPLGQSIAPTATTTLQLGGNLKSSSAADGTSTVSTAMGVVDSLGATTQVRFDFTKTGDNAWKLEAFDDAGVSLGTTALTFNSSTGAMNPLAGPVSFTLPARGGATATTFTADFGAPGTAKALTQFGGSNTVAAIGQDGATTGYLRSFAIGDDGTVSGSFSNGRIKVLAQLSVSGFTNPAGLIKAGASHMRASASSGASSIGLPGDQGRGTLAAGTLEGSNVDLAQEFTNLMIAQRGFQANSRIISTSDEMLQELVNLKH